MSAGDPQPASDPPPPRPGRFPARENPLRRPCDRAESRLNCLLLLVLVIGLPWSAVGVGLAAYDSSMRTMRAQTAERHQVTAELTSVRRDSTPGGTDQARVRWTERTGVEHEGSAPVEPGTRVGTSIRIWVDRDGNVVRPPMTALDAKAAGWAMGGLTAVAGTAGYAAARAATRHAMDRWRYAQWDAEWDLVEPVWSARFSR
ncbi:hypothetical protein [Streptomyces boncukensis]|uniref:Integral membrane protein n=1 Tax=Streptomyces boncukensis TaxID=2711219 RepID=A0A6G4WPP8_9ACTN|nr:hypothetical protein [Streptomyces boncukensis]NGO67236.1 hypothetical protein [Streptomyces boncukensis]